MRCVVAMVEFFFLDFEHFGWDDPAKMIADFLLHPAMVLDAFLKRRFVANILSCFEDRETLEKRVEILYPLFGLKWCMILLNEFVPEDLLRREFACEASLEKDEVQTEQLKKSRQMLKRIRRSYGHAPYSN